MQTTERSVEAAAAGGSRQMLTFSLGAELYAIDILQVKEIRGWSPVTRIPRSTQAVLGVLNLRGAIVPIIDLRVRFALRAAQLTPATVIIVLSLQARDGVRECGIVVDSVHDVVEIPTGNIRPAPSMNGAQAAEFIDGITACDETLLILLDASRIVAGDLPPVPAAGVAA